MTDTHTHLYMTDVYPDGGISAIEAAIQAGVDRFVLPGVNLDTVEPMIALHSKFPQATVMAIGLHPTDLEDDWEKVLDRMEQMLPGEYGAIGEVGIDLYHDASRREEQKIAFARQIEWAVRYDLPLIIHCRNGLDDTLEVLARFKERVPKIVFHSFTGDADDVKRIREICNPWFGINGVVTFKNAPALRSALPEIGLDKIVLETDAPWLSPVPYRGTINDSSRIPIICERVAEVFGVDKSVVELTTDRNAEQIFAFAKP